MPSLLQTAVFLFASLSTLVCAQDAESTGYFGYQLTHSGDPEGAVYETSSTPSNASAYPEPDVFLNATVHVEEIDIIVDDLVAKINLDAQVLNLLQFNAGVDASIDRVSLMIKKVRAEVLLEARLGNLVLMVEDILKSLDLNPILATLGQGLGQIVNHTVGTLTGDHPNNGAQNGGQNGGRLSERSFGLEHNVLYSVNDYSGHTHTNRILAQNGSIMDLSLDDHAHIIGEQLVGYYLSDMTATGHSKEVYHNGKPVTEQEYLYAPFPGLRVYSLIFTGANGVVRGAQVIGEASAGGSSTIGDDED